MDYSDVLVAGLQVPLRDQSVLQRNIWPVLGREEWDI